MAEATHNINVNGVVSNKVSTYSFFSQSFPIAGVKENNIGFF